MITGAAEDARLSTRPVRAARIACFVQMLVQHLRACWMSHLLVLTTMAVGGMGMAATFFIGDGALTGLWRDMEQLMGSQMTILPDPGPNGALLKRRPVMAFTDADLAYLRAHVSKAKYITAYQIFRDNIEAEGLEFAMMVEGATPELCNETAFRPTQGRGLSESAHSGLAFECLVTQSAFTRLNLHEGSRIRVDTQLFEVVGVIPDPPNADSRFQTRVVVPFTAMRLLHGNPGYYAGFVIGWNRADEMEPLLLEVHTAMRACVGPECYYLSSSLITVQKRKRVVSNIMAFSTAQAIFCVLVASIGIANVMLANVMRRSREYAIRISSGARKADIFNLVVCESLLIGLTGGFLGVGLGALIAPLACGALANHIREAANLSPAFGFRGLLVPLAVCGISGMLAGVFPALKTVRLDVLSNLRAE